jgi:hypothetical protein
MRGKHAHNMDYYYYQWHTTDLCWQSFDSDAARYRIGYGGLLKAAALFFSECLPTLRRQMTSDGRESRNIGWCAPYFSGIGSLSAAGQDELEKLLSALTRFLSFFAGWMVQVTRTIPPTMRPARQDQPLTAPATTPSMMYFWQIRYMMMIGTMSIMMQAIMAPILTVP